jgi:hypothetical protein
MVAFLPYTVTTIHVASSWLESLLRISENRLQISSRMRGYLTEEFMAFQSLLGDDEIVPEIRPRMLSFLPFPIHSCLITLLFDVA